MGAVLKEKRFSTVTDPRTFAVWDRKSGQEVSSAYGMAFKQVSTFADKYELPTADVDTTTAKADFKTENNITNSKADTVFQNYNSAQTHLCSRLCGSTNHPRWQCLSCRGIQAGVRQPCLQLARSATAASV